MATCGSAYAPPPPAKVLREASPGYGLLTIRILRPPVELEVITNDAHDPVRPLQLRTVSDAESDRRLHLDSIIRIASGPWALEERWWSDHPVDRNYWDVELESGGIYRVFQDNRTRTWFVDGVYD